MWKWIGSGTVVVVLCLAAWWLSRAWYPPEPSRRAELRENPAQLMPHVFEDIAKCIEELERESFEGSHKKLRGYQGGFSSLNRRRGFMAGAGAEHSLQVGLRRTYLDVHPYLALLANRRFAKVAQALEKMESGQRQELVAQWWDQALRRCQKPVRKWFFSDDFNGILEEMQVCLLLLGRFGTFEKLAEAIESIQRETQRLYGDLQKEEQAGRFKNATMDKAYLSFPSPTVQFHACCLALQNTDISFASHVRNFEQFVIPVSRWDAALVGGDEGRMFYKTEAEVPSYIVTDAIGYYPLYVWPEALTIVGPQGFESFEEQKTQVERLMELFR